MTLAAKIQSGVTGGAPDQALSAGPFAIRLARLRPGLRLPPHAHEPATLNIVLDGEYREAIEQGALCSHGPATIIAKPAGAVHANQLGAEPVECLVSAHLTRPCRRIRPLSNGARISCGDFPTAHNPTFLGPEAPASCMRLLGSRRGQQVLDALLQIPQGSRCFLVFSSRGGALQ
jgi:hypothetical protein